MLQNHCPYETEGSGSIGELRGQDFTTRRFAVRLAPFPAPLLPTVGAGTWREEGVQSLGLACLDVEPFLA